MLWLSLLVVYFVVVVVVVDDVVIVLMLCFTNLISVPINYYSLP